MLYFCVFMFKKCAFSKKVHFFCIFLIKNLHISKICCNFAPSFKKGRTQHQLETQKIETKMKTNNNEIANVIAGQFVTATRNFMEWNKKMNPFHLSQFRDQYCDAISELIPFCFSINNIEIKR